VTAKRSVVLGCGSYLPRKVLTNAELATRIDTSDEWVRTRTGICERRIAADGEQTSDLAMAASLDALAAAEGRGGREPWANARVADERRSSYRCDLTTTIVQSLVDGYPVCGFPFNFSRAAR